MLSQIENEKVDGYIFVGDVVGYFCRLNETLDILRQLNPLLYVKGNHDRNYLSCKDDPARRRAYCETYGDSYEIELSLENQSFLEEKPECMDLDMDYGRIYISHGSMLDPMDGRIYPDKLEVGEDYANYKVCIHGHTHYKMLREIGNTTIINPGSLGQPRDGLGFSYCIYDFKTMECQFRTVDLTDSEIQQLVNENKRFKQIKQYLIAKMVIKK